MGQVREGSIVPFPACKIIPHCLTHSSLLTKWNEAGTIISIREINSPAGKCF